MTKAIICGMICSLALSGCTSDIAQDLAQDFNDSMHTPVYDVLQPIIGTPFLDTYSLDMGSGARPDTPSGTHFEERAEREMKIQSRPWTDAEVHMLAQVVYGEAGCTSDVEKAAVAWCILNRVDSPLFPDTIREVITAPRQFLGYSPSHPIDDHILWLVQDVLDRWWSGSDGRVLPADFLYFTGDGRHNYFTKEYMSGVIWDFSLPNPYKGA